MREYSARQFAFIRVFLGAYLLIHFVRIVPFAEALFSSEGMVPDHSLNYAGQYFPHLFLISDSPQFVKAVVISGALFSFCFMVGLWRRASSLVLWFIWASLFNRNNLIMNPGLPFVGWLLLACALIPDGEGYSVGRKGDGKWYMPPILFNGAWLIMSIGYTLSGVDKTMSPGWIEGTAVYDVLGLSLARSNFLTDLLRTVPLSVWKGVTWLTLFFELAFLPCIVLASTRAAAWSCMVLMHIVLLLVCAFPDLTMGMLIYHAFTFDSRWLLWLKRKSSY